MTRGCRRCWTSGSEGSEGWRMLCWKCDVTLGGAEADAVRRGWKNQWRTR